MQVPCCGKIAELLRVFALFFQPEKKDKRLSERSPVLREASEIWPAGRSLS